MKSFLNSTLVFFGLILCAILLVLPLFSIFDDGVDCERHRGSSSCRLPEKVFYFPECEAVPSKNNLTPTQRPTFTTKSGIIPPYIANDAGRPPFTRCDIHRLFHLPNSISGSSISLDPKDENSTSVTDDEAERAWQKLMATGSESKKTIDSVEIEKTDNVRNTQITESLTVEQRIINAFNERDRKGPALCKTIKTISQGVSEHIATTFGMDPRTISLGRAWYAPLSVTEENFPLFVPLMNLEFLNDLNQDKFKYINCQVIIYTQRGLINCYTMEPDIVSLEKVSGIVSKVYACKKPN